VKHMSPIAYVHQIIEPISTPRNNSASHVAERNLALILWYMQDL